MKSSRKTISATGPSNTKNPKATPKCFKCEDKKKEFFKFKTFVWKAKSVLIEVQLLVLGLDRVKTHTQKGVKDNSNEDIMKSHNVLVNRMNLTGVNSDFFDCHKLGAKKNTARPVLVRFSSVQVRARIWRAKTILKETKIKLTEFLI